MPPDLKVGENCHLTNCSEGEISAKERDGEEWTVYGHIGDSSINNARTSVDPWGGGRVGGSV